MKQQIVEITENGLVLARFIPAKAAWQGGLNFFSSDGDFIQAGVWGYDTGEKLAPHIHNLVAREVPYTQEVLFVKSGAVRANIFGVSGTAVDTVDLKAGDIIIMLSGGHGYEILEDGTQVLEIKNGPYLGANTDRRRL